MELHPLSMSENTLKVWFEGLQEPTFFEVSYRTAEKAMDLFKFGVEEDEYAHLDLGDYPMYADLPLLSGHWAFLNIERIVLVQHLFEIFPSSSIPPERYYGASQTEDLEKEEKWFHPLVVYGIEGVGVMELHDQGPSEQSMLRDSMVEGHPVSRFLDFIDDDGEWNVVSADKLAFSVFHPDTLPNRQRFKPGSQLHP